MFNDATVILSMSWSIYKLYWVKILRLRNYSTVYQILTEHVRRVMERRAETVLSLAVLVLGLLQGCQAAVSLICLFVCLCISSIIDISWMFLAITKCNFTVYFLSFKIDVDNGEEYFLNCCEKVLTSSKLLVSLKNNMAMNQLILKKNSVHIGQLSFKFDILCLTF